MRWNSDDMRSMLEEIDDAKFEEAVQLRMGERRLDRRGAGRLWSRLPYVLGVACLLLALGAATVNIVRQRHADADVEIVRVEGDRVIYSNIDELTAAAELIVIGTYAKETEQELQYGYSGEDGKAVLTNAVSSNELLVKKVLAGDVKEGETLKISQRYGVVEDTNQLITFSEMTPMEKDDSWIFFLYYDELNDTWWCAGDYTGRYPVPSDEIRAVSERVLAAKAEGVDGYAEALCAEDFGVYEKELINIELYCDIINRFECMLE